MEKIFRNIFFALALCCGFTACSDDDDVIYSQWNADGEYNTAGTYSGTWTSTTGSTVTTAEGTLTLEATESTGVTKATSYCSDLGLDFYCVANIVGVNDEYVFYNDNTDYILEQVQTCITTATTANSYEGTVSSENVATLSFTTIARSGRSTTTTYYSFEGTKQ